MRCRSVASLYGVVIVLSVVTLAFYCDHGVLGSRHHSPAAGAADQLLASTTPPAPPAPPAPQPVDSAATATAQLPQPSSGLHNLPTATTARADFPAFRLPARLPAAASDLVSEVNWASVSLLRQALHPMHPMYPSCDSAAPPWRLHRTTSASVAVPHRPRGALAPASSEACVTIQRELRSRLVDSSM